jgi:hypothetical protein
MFDWIKRGFQKAQPAADPYEQFIRDLVAECQRRNCMPKSYDPQARAFLFDSRDGGEMSFQLGNIFGIWLQQDTSDRAGSITRFVQSVEEACKLPLIVPEKLPGELMPGIRSRTQISNALIRNWTLGAPTDDSTATAFVPFEGDLVACVLRTFDYSLSPMANNNLSVGGLSFEQAMSHARKNFHDRLPRPVFEPFGDEVYCCSNLADHQSALLLLQPGQDYPLPPIDGGPIATVPGRNLFYLTGSANRPGLARLLDIAERAQQKPHFCSSAILQWDGGRWGEARLDADLAARQRWIAQHQLATDYQSQQQLLDSYHLQQGKDIFIASFRLYSPKDSSVLISTAALGSGTTGTLLPRADELLFIKQIVDPQTGLASRDRVEDDVTVTWSSAMDIVGHLLESVPYLNPPRFRAVGFPQTEEWARLKAAAR